MTDHDHPTDVSEAEEAAQEGVGSGDEGYSGPEPTDGLTADDCTLTCECVDCPILRFSGPAGASLICGRPGCGKSIGVHSRQSAAPHGPPFTPLPGRVVTQVTHAQARSILDALPPESKRTDEDNVTANVLGYALKQPETPREDGDWGYNATGPQS